MNKLSFVSLFMVGVVALVLGMSTLFTQAWADNANATNGVEKAQVDKTASGTGAESKKPYKEEAIRHYNRGHDLHQQGFFNQAISEYKAALSIDDRMEEAYTNLGLIYAAQRNYNKAIEAFKKSLALNPKRANALNGLGTVLYAKNRLNEAMSKWHDAVSVDPHFASAYYNMGNALENEKEYQQAVDAYVDALSAAPAMADAYYRIGGIYVKQKHLAQAGILLSRAIQLQPNAEFVHDAKKSLENIGSELKGEGGDEPEVKMNIIAPPAQPRTTETTSTTEAVNQDAAASPNPAPADDKNNSTAKTGEAN